MESEGYVYTKCKRRNLKESKEGCGGRRLEVLAELSKQCIHYLKTLHKPTFLCKNAAWNN